MFLRSRLIFIDPSHFRPVAAFFDPECLDFHGIKSRSDAEKGGHPVLGADRQVGKNSRRRVDPICKDLGSVIHFQTFDQAAACANGFKTLIPIFFFRIRTKWLKFFLTMPKSGYFIRELAINIGEDAKNISRKLNILENIGFLKSEKRELQKYYSI